MSDAGIYYLVDDMYVYRYLDLKKRVTQHQACVPSSTARRGQIEDISYKSPLDSSRSKNRAASALQKAHSFPTFAYFDITHA
jgi:hypothetical protein